MRMQKYKSKKNGGYWRILWKQKKRRALIEGWFGQTNEMRFSWEKVLFKEAFLENLVALK